MARELKLVLWCDGEHDEDVVATVSRTLSVDGAKPVLLDLCEVCDKTVQDIVEFMERGVLASKATTAPHARTPRAALPIRAPETTGRPKKPGSDRTDCLEEGCDYDAPTRTALGQHVKSKHSRLLSDYNWANDPNWGK